MDRLKILDIWVDPVDMDAAVGKVSEFVEQGTRPHSILAVNPEKNFSVPKNPELWKLFESADLLIPDGIGVVLAARVLHGVRFGRVPGADLMERICGLAAEKGYGVFFYGSKEETNRRAAEVLAERYPGLIVAGRSDGYVPPDKMPDLIDRINASGARILFLALGSPKQEQWYAEHKVSLTQVRVCQGIGGTLDTIAGNVKRAPAFWQALGLEWFYRLVSEPKRVGRQKVLPIFGYRVLAAKLKSYFTTGTSKENA